MDDDFHMRAAELLYNWATEDGNWVTQGAVDSLMDEGKVIEDIDASQGDAAARLVYDRWEDVWAEVADRIELEMSDD